MAKKRKFTAKRERFIELVVESNNAAESARGAGYSKKTADRIGHQLLNILEIREEVERRRAELSAKTEITAERILNELADLAFADSELVAPPHKIKALDLLSRYVGLNNNAEIDKAKAVKKDEEAYNPDPTAGLSEDDIDKQIGELDR